MQLIKTWVAHALHGRSLQVLLGEPTACPIGQVVESYLVAVATPDAVSYRLPGCGSHNPPEKGVAATAPFLMQVCGLQVWQPQP